MEKNCFLIIEKATKAPHNNCNVATLKSTGRFLQLKTLCQCSAEKYGKNTWQASVIHENTSHLPQKLLYKKWHSASAQQFGLLNHLTEEDLMGCKSMAVDCGRWCVESKLAFGILSMSITENGQIASKQLTYKTFWVSLLVFHVFRGN